MNDINDFFQDQEESNIDFKSIFFKYLSYWPLYLFSVLLLLFLAKIYLKYQPNIYQANASVLIKNDKGGVLSDLSGIEGLFSKKDIIEDEILIIKSLPVITKVVENLDLNVNYSRKANYSKKNIEYFEDSPIIVEVFSNSDLKKNYQLIVEFINNNVLEVKHNQQIIKSEYFKRIKLDDNTTIVIKPNPLFATNFNHELFVDISSIEVASLNLIGQLNIESTSKQSNAINLSIKSPNLSKSKKILNETVKQYFENSILEKKISISNTTDFIRERIILLDSELREIENQLKSFKQFNKLTDLVTEANLFSESSARVNQKVFDAELQLNLVNGLSNRLNQNTYETLPVNQGLNDVSINSSIARYNELVIQKGNISTSATDLNPDRIIIDKQLKEIKKSIVDGLNNQKRMLELTLDNIKRESSSTESKLRSIPSQEKEMREINRQHATKEALFLYLLQKREELAITETSLEPNARLINYAYGSSKPISPKPKIIYIIFFLIGLLIPTFFIYFRYLLDSKIHNIEYLDKKSMIPNIGFLPKIKNSNTRVLLSVDDRSSIAEALRLVITNVEFILADVRKCKTILTTSTLSSEGKSFISANIASYLAYSGRKVILLGFDLRAPKLHEFFDYENELGITHYIKKTEIKIEDIIIPIKGYDNLDIIHSGLTIPNFVELMKNSRIEELFNALKQQYDYIIIDSAPVGLVSDTLNLSKYCDLTLFIIKAHFLDKKMLTVSNKLFKENKLPQMKSILNAVDVEKSTYGYGYTYGQNYIYGYGNDKENFSSYKFKFWHRNFYKNWFNKK